MLSQALKADNGRRLLIVANCADANATEQRRKEIAKALEVDEIQVSMHVGTAKQYLELPDLKSSLLSLIPTNPDAPF
jgi:hypothetical protein